MGRAIVSRKDIVWIIILSVEWITFGTLHFILLPLTISQLPQCIPFKSLVVAITGIVEITTGILVLLPTTRKIAAIASVALVVLFLPAVYHILTVDSPLYDGVVSQQLLRVVIIPNNVFLAWCAYQILMRRSSHYYVSD